MELIQIDTIKWACTSSLSVQFYSLPAAVFVDAETGVVYFNGMYPRYDANGRVMVIPRDQLPAAHLFCLSVSLMGYSSFHFTFTFSNFRCRGSDKGYTETQICK